MIEYLLRVHPINTIYDEEMNISQQRHFATVIDNWLKNTELLNKIFLIELIDGSIMAIFEQPAYGWTEEWFPTQFDEMFKYTNGYAFEVLKAE